MFELFEIDNNVCSLIRWFCSIQVKSDVIGLHLIDQTLGPQMKRIYTTKTGTKWPHSCLCLLAFFRRMEIAKIPISLSQRKATLLLGEKLFCEHEKRENETTCKVVLSKIGLLLK